MVEPGGGCCRSRGAGPQVAVTDLFDIFDGNAAQNFRTATRSLAYGFAGRGADPQPEPLTTMLASLTSVTDALASRRARVAGFARAFARAGDALAPVAEPATSLTETTFGALAANSTRAPHGDSSVPAPSATPPSRNKPAARLARTSEARRSPPAEPAAFRWPLRRSTAARRAGGHPGNAGAGSSDISAADRDAHAASRERPAYASSVRGLADMIAAVSGMLHGPGSGVLQRLRALRP